MLTTSVTKSMPTAKPYFVIRAFVKCSATCLGYSEGGHLAHISGVQARLPRQRNDDDARVDGAHTRMMQVL